MTVTGPQRGSLSFDRMADRYDATRGGEARGADTARLLLPHLPAGLVLELGIGTGLVGAALARAGRDVVGVDLSPRMLARAADRLPGRVAVADVERLPVADRSVAACVAVHVMHLVGDRRAVLAEAARVLSPDGRLLLVVVDDQLTDSGQLSDIGELRQRISRAVLGGGPRRDSPAELLPLAADAGLTLLAEALEEYDGEPVTPAAAAAGIEARLWSALWDVTDDVWAAVVAPLVAQLRSLPGQDRPRVARERRRVLVLGPAA